VLFRSLRTEAPDFTPRQLATVRAVLKPPGEKRRAERKPDQKPEEKRPAPPEQPVDVAPTNRPAPIKRAMDAVGRITSGNAIAKLLTAANRVGGSKGYGELGLGTRLSSLIGKPPIAQMGLGNGQGLGGFGAETRGINSLRGTGTGDGFGIGSLAVGGTGRQKVGGTVVFDPKRRPESRGGDLPRELIQKVISEHIGEVRTCYERALLHDPGLSGSLVLEWTIDLNGRVARIGEKRVTLKSAEVPNCVMGSLRTWIFPRPRGGVVVVTYPFLFNAVGF
jgi:hypothetical protein